MIHKSCMTHGCYLPTSYFKNTVYKNWDKNTKNVSRQHFFIFFLSECLQKNKCDAPLHNEALQYFGNTPVPLSLIQYTFLALSETSIICKQCRFEEYFNPNYGKCIDCWPTAQITNLTPRQQCKVQYIIGCGQ